MFDTALLFFGVGISIGMMIAIVVGVILAVPVALIFLHGVYEVIIAPIVKGLWEGFIVKKMQENLVVSQKSITFALANEK